MAAPSFKRTVLIPVDGSINADQAFNFYCKCLQYPGDRIVLFHHMDIVSTTSDPDEALQDVLDQKRCYISGLKELFTSKAVSHGINTKQLHLEIAVHPLNPGKAITKFIKNNNVHFVVLGCRGLGKIKKAFLGSVSEYVTRNAGVPVMTVPQIKMDK